VPGLDCSGSGWGQVAGCYEHGNVRSGSKTWTSRGTACFSRRTLLHGVTGIWDRQVNLQTQLIINHQWPIRAQTQNGFPTWLISAPNTEDEPAYNTAS